MSADDPAMSPDEADALLAIELAFDLLEPGLKADANARVRSDPAFAELYSRWQARALALLEGREGRPPARVWTAIARRLPANDTGALRWWQAASGVAAAVALALGATLALRPAPAPVPAIVQEKPGARPLVAVLASAERDDIIAISFDVAARRMVALPEQLTTEGRAAELWVIPKGGKPVAAGLLTPGRRTQLMTGPQLAGLIVPGATLAVSLEPPGGSPTGAPTGPVILTGTIARS